MSLIQVSKSPDQKEGQRRREQYRECAVILKVSLVAESRRGTETNRLMESLRDPPRAVGAKGRVQESQELAGWWQRH